MTAPNVVTGGPVRAAIVGTGYIAEFHVRGIQNAREVELVAVCDSNATVAKAFAAGLGVPAYSSLQTMLAEQRVDVVHLLVPPDLHHPLAKVALEAGANVFIEKPMCVSAEETRDLLDLAGAKGLTIGVNHSMLFEGAFQRLRDHVRNGDLGPLDHVTFNHFAELAFIRFGPFGNWMLREPGNALLEIGPHPVSGLVDLLGVPDEIQVAADRDIVLPGGARAYRRWRIHTRVGRTAADINIELGPGFPQRTIAVRGLLGTALAAFRFPEGAIPPFEHLHDRQADTRKSRFRPAQARRLDCVAGECAGPLDTCRLHSDEGQAAPPWQPVPAVDHEQHRGLLRRAALACRPG